MRKFTAIISALLLALNCINVSAKVDKDYTNITEVDGIVFTEGSENAEVSVSSGSLLLDANVSTETQKTGAYYISPLIGMDENDDVFNFTCEFEVKATDNLTANRYIQLAWGDCSALDSVSKTALVNITKNKITIGMSGKDYAAVNNGTHLICGSVNLEEGKITVYYDGVAIAENQSFSLSSGFDISTARLMFSNYFNPKAENQYSEFYISSYLASSHNLQNGPVIKTTADELGVLNASSLADGFYINFGAGLKEEPTVSLYESYGTQNEREMEIESSYNGYMINISPKNEDFADMKSYTAIVDGISYISGETIDREVFSITTLDENYVKPTITITSPENNANFRTGNTVEIVAEVTQGSEEIEKVEILVNNEVIDTLSNGGTSEWTPDAVGNYEIKAVVTDTFGTSSEDVVNVLVSENSAPTVQFDVNDNAVLGLTDIINIQATDTDGEVEYIEVFSDGALLETVDGDSAVFEVKELANGNHTLLIKAYDNEGGVGTASLNITVKEEVITNYVDEDFEGFTADMKTLPGLYFYSSGGYYEPVTVDAEHGTSFLIGTNQETFEQAGKRDILFEINSNKEYNVYKAVYEFDIMINNAAVGTMIRGNTAAAPDVTNATSIGVFSIKNNSVTFGNQTMEVLDDTWYHVKFIPDLNNSYVTLEFTGNGNKLEGRMELDTQLARISDLTRLTFTLNDKTRSDFKVILDNMKFSKISELPTVAGITDGTGNTDVDYSSEYIKVAMDGNISEIKADDVVLYNTNGEQKVSKVEIDENDSSVLYVYPEGSFMSGDEYTVKIKGGVVSEAGTYTNDTICNFTTAPKPFDVLDGEVKKTGNSVSFTTSFTNTTEGTKKATMLLVLYKNGVFESITPKEVEVSTTSKSDTVSVPVTGSNYTAYGLIVDEIGGMLPESNKLFELK